MRLVSDTLLFYDMVPAGFSFYPQAITGTGGPRRTDLFEEMVNPSPPLRENFFYLG